MFARCGSPERRHEEIKREKLETGEEERRGREGGKQRGGRRDGGKEAVGDAEIKEVRGRKGNWRDAAPAGCVCVCVLHVKDALLECEKCVIKVPLMFCRVQPPRHRRRTCSSAYYSKYTADAPQP